MKKMFLTLAVAFTACVAMSCTSEERKDAAQGSEEIQEQTESTPQQADEAQTNVDDTEALSQD